MTDVGGTYTNLCCCRNLIHNLDNLNLTCKPSQKNKHHHKKDGLDSIFDEYYMTNIRIHHKKCRQGKRPGNLNRPNSSLVCSCTEYRRCIDNLSMINIQNMVNSYILTNHSCLNKSKNCNRSIHMRDN
jgi:hypothetical protein